jgi:hypothetical protein
MMVLHIKCVKCNNNMCNSTYFQYNFINWASGNNEIDKFIQSTQLLAHKKVSDALEWIPYDRFCNIKNSIAEGELDKVYRANWIDGHISKWDNSSQNWKRDEPNMLVILKILTNPSSITSKFINKV